MLHPTARLGYNHSQPLFSASIYFLYLQSTAMYQYQSDTTQFLNQYLQENPAVAAERLENRAILWDVELKPEEQADFAAAALPKKPYAYQPD